MKLPQTWIFDAHLLDQGWERPRCQQSCPTGVFEAVKISDAEMQQRVDEESLEVLQPSLNTKPRVYYRNLYRYMQCFIGGSLFYKVNDVDDCLGGAKISVRKGEEIVGSAISDAYGEFKVDKIPANSGDYQVFIEHEDFHPLIVDVTVSQSEYIGAKEMQAK